MNKIIMIVALYLISGFVFSQESIDSIFIASYNLENLFDIKDDPNKNDDEFLPNSDKNWNEEKLAQKMQNLARVVNYMNNLKRPDILSVQEVENEQILKEFIDNELSDKNYGIVYAESPDNRGIDCGLIYDTTKFKQIKKYALEVSLDDNYPTRLILGAKFLHGNSGNEIYIFVNHWPSRRGGEEASEPNRMRASETLQKKLDEIITNDQFANIVIIGDFNDEPSNNSITAIASDDLIACENKEFDKTQFVNLALDYFKDGKGTYLYRGDWNMLDQMIVSSQMLNNDGISYSCNSFEVIKPAFVLQKEGNYKGSSLPTFGGRKYFGGFSDHFPIGAIFRIQKKINMKQ